MVRRECNEVKLKLKRNEVVVVDRIVESLAEVRLVQYRLVELSLEFVEYSKELELMKSQVWKGIPKMHGSICRFVTEKE